MKLQPYLTLTLLGITLCFTAAKAQTVYITESGKKYHAKHCEGLKNGKAISLKDAEKQGYTACDFCKTVAADKKEKVKTEKKKDADKG